MTLAEEQAIRHKLAAAIRLVREAQERLEEAERRARAERKEPQP